MEVLIYVLIGIVSSLVSYVFWCYSYTRNGKASSFYDYMRKNGAYDWIFFGSVLWPFSLLLLIGIGMILVINNITKWIRHMFGINE